MGFSHPNPSPLQSFIDSITHHFIRRQTQCVKLAVLNHTNQPQTSFHPSETCSMFDFFLSPSTLTDYLSRIELWLSLSFGSVPV